MPIRYFFSFLLLLSIWSCTEEELTISPEASAYLDEMIGVMQSNSINRNTIDWDDFRAQVYERAGTAQRIEELNGAIVQALLLLGDNHSLLRRADGAFLSGSLLNCSAPEIDDVEVPEGIGYVRVSAFSGPSDAAAVTFADGIQEQIRRADTTGLRGWIVDLRGNPGGNMWPMLAGVGPLLGEGTAGYFIEPDSTESEWGYASGNAYLDGNIIIRTSDPYTPLRSDYKVAVLLDEVVASSGEAIAIAFIGRPNTRSFGTPTCGQSTSNQGFNLRDGSTLFLTTAYMADRNRNVFGVPVPPDVPTSSPEETWQQALGYLQE
mgnify:CR=1 FL=1